jgi:hypothetical protein
MMESNYAEYWKIKGWQQKIKMSPFCAESDSNLVSMLSPLAGAISNLEAFARHNYLIRQGPVWIANQLYVPSQGNSSIVILS